MSTPVSALKIGKYYIDFNKMLGKGNTGNVFQGINTETQQQIAVKAIQMNQIQGQVTHYLLQSQKKALNTIKSPYIIKNLDVIQLKDQCLIVTQFCAKGSLKDYISKKQKLSNSQAIQLFRKILIGYIAISEALFIHRDLKTANILLRNNGEPVIIDFGYSQMMMAKRPLIQYNVGSPSYMAPQVYAKSRYSEKSDIWSLGVIIHEMLTGKTLDHGYTDMHDFFRTLQKQGKPKINTQGMSQVCIQLLNMALQVQPQKRGTCHKLKYLIDKSLIPQMQNQLNKVLCSKINKHQQHQSGVRKIIPNTHFNYETSQQTSAKYHINLQQINTIKSTKSVQKTQSLSILPNSPTASKQQIFKNNIYQNTISLKTIPNHINYTNPIYPPPQHQSHLHSKAQLITNSHQNKQIIQKYIPTDHIQYQTRQRNSFTGYNTQSKQLQKTSYIHNLPYNTNYNQQIARSPQNMNNNRINLRIE